MILRHLAGDEDCACPHCKVVLWYVDKSSEQHWRVRGVTWVLMSFLVKTLTLPAGRDVWLLVLNSCYRYIAFWRRIVVVYVKNLLACEVIIDWSCQQSLRRAVSCASGWLRVGGEDVRAPQVAGRPPHEGPAGGAGDHHGAHFEKRRQHSDPRQVWFWHTPVCVFQCVLHSCVLCAAPWQG